jgi:hypothetical protein
MYRLGFIVDFLSHATIVGFMAGAATVVCLQQLKGMLGLDHFTTSTDVVSVMDSVFTQTHQVHSILLLLIHPMAAMDAGLCIHACVAVCTTTRRRRRHGQPLEQAEAPLAPARALQQPKVTSRCVRVRQGQGRADLHLQRRQGHECPAVLAL